MKDDLEDYFSIKMMPFALYYLSQNGDIVTYECGSERAATMCQVHQILLG